MGFLLSWYFLVPFLLISILFVYIGRVRRLPLLRSKKSSRVSWKEIQDYAGVPSALLVLLLGWWLVSRGSEAPWSFGSAMRTPQFLVGLFLFIILVATYILGVHKDFEKRFSRRVLTAIAIVSGLLLMAWATIPQTRVLWASLTQPASGPVRVAAAAPVVRDPLETALPCRVIFTEQIPPDSAARDSLAVHGGGTNTLYWTAATLTRPLLEGIAWPLLPDSTRAKQAKVRTAHLSGHLDEDDRWDPATGRHLWVPVTEPRVEGFDGYCLGWIYHYALARGFLERLWPLATGVVRDPDDPNKEVFTFSKGPIELLVEDGENPTLFFLHHNPPGNGRRHRAVFRIEISPA